jgi:phage-related minor tail protein
MNRFLFDTLTFINGFLAVIIIAGFTLQGWVNPYMQGAKVLGVIIGLLAGIAVAAVVCGTIAFLALIERHMRTIADRGPAPLVHPSDRLLDYGRQEPRL